MSFRLFIIGSIYPGSLQSFYQKNKNFKELSYQDHYHKLLAESTDFVCSYTKTFNKLGIKASCIIANDGNLLEKWRLENDVNSKNIKEILFEQIKKYKPTALFIEDSRFVDKSWIDAIKREISTVQKIFAYHCAPYHSKILEVLQSADFLITCTPGLETDFEKKGIRTYLVYHGFDTDWLPKIKENIHTPECELLFSGSLFPGNGYHKDRIELIELILKAKIDISLFVNLERKYKIRVKQAIYLINVLLKKLKINSLKSYFPILEYGAKPVKNYSHAIYKAKQEPVFGLEMYKILSKSKIVLNNHVEAAGNYAGNMRLFEATGIGCCLLTDKKDNLVDLFEPDKELIAYENPVDCLNKLKWLLEHEAERKKIAEAGHKKTLTSHTVENRCMQMIEIIKNELSSH